MPLERTLQQVQADIDAGDLGKARDRLHGLIVTYPDNLELRERLARVYWQLKLPEMAGRYWYLAEHKDADMLRACQRFEAQFRNDPLLLLFALKFKGSTERIRDTPAGQVLLELDRRAHAKHPWYRDYRERGAARFRHYKRDVGKQHGLRSAILKWSCIVAAVIFALLVLVGAAVGMRALAQWLTR